MGFPKRGIAQPGQTPPIVARIDDVIHTSGTAVCACGCGREIRSDSASPWFAAESCQILWNRRLATPDIPAEPEPDSDQVPVQGCTCITCLPRAAILDPVYTVASSGFWRRFGDRFRRARAPHPDQPHPQTPTLLRELETYAAERPRLRRFTTVPDGPTMRTLIDTHVQHVLADLARRGEHVAPTPLTEQEVILGDTPASSPALTEDQQRLRDDAVLRLAAGLEIDPADLPHGGLNPWSVVWSLPEGVRFQWDTSPLMHPPANPFQLDPAGNVCSPRPTSAITLVPSTDWGDNTTTVRIQSLDTEGRPVGEPTILVGVDPASIRATYEEPA